MSWSETVAVKTPLIGPTPAVSRALYWSGPAFAICSQPGMHFSRTAGSVSAAKTRSRGASILWVPSIFKAETSYHKGHEGTQRWLTRKQDLCGPLCRSWLICLFGPRSRCLQRPPRVNRRQLLAIFGRGVKVRVDIHTVGGACSGGSERFGIESGAVQRAFHALGAIRFGRDSGNADSC